MTTLNNFAHSCKVGSWGVPSRIEPKVHSMSLAKDGLVAAALTGLVHNFPQKSGHAWLLEIGMLGIVWLFCARKMFGKTSSFKNCIAAASIILLGCKTSLQTLCGFSFWLCSLCSLHVLEQLLKHLNASSSSACQLMTALTQKNYKGQQRQNGIWHFLLLGDKFFIAFWLNERNTHGKVFCPQAKFRHRSNRPQTENFGPWNFSGPVSTANFYHKSLRNFFYGSSWLLRSLDVHSKGIVLCYKESVQKPAALFCFQSYWNGRGSRCHHVTWICHCTWFAPPVQGLCSSRTVRVVRGTWRQNGYWPTHCSVNDRGRKAAHPGCDSPRLVRWWVQTSGTTASRRHSAQLLSQLSDS